MRNLKKFLALVLAMLMVVGSTAMVSAGDFTDVAADNVYAAAIEDLTTKDIIQGIDGETFGPDQKVTREQMAIFFARIITGETDDAVWNTGVNYFPDVTKYQGAIQTVYLAGIIDGMPSGNYEPYANITYLQALKMGVCALGFGTDADGDKLSWPAGYWSMANELGLTKNLTTITNIDQALTREETAQIIYNVINADRADSDKTFAEENFAVSTAANTDLFVITATPAQYHGINGWSSDSASDNKDIKVGVQALQDGVPTGELFYVKAEDLGIDATKVEDYFFRAVELINFKDGEFDRAVIGEAPTTVFNSEIKNSKFALTIDGKVYRALDKSTASALYNEIAIYNGLDIDENVTKLIISGDYVLNAKGERVAHVVTSSAATVDARVYTDLTTGETLTEREALERYGISIAHGTIDVADLYDKAYALELYDDDRDGYYDRAVYNPIFLGVYNTYKENGKVYDSLVAGVYDVLTNDAINGADFDLEAVYNETTSAWELQEVYTSARNYNGNIEIALAANVSYTNEAAQKVGAVSAFTYNPQLKTVEVIEVLAMQTATIGQVTHGDASYDSVSAKFVNNMVLDGDDYKFFYFDHAETNGNGSKLYWDNDGDKTTADVEAVDGNNVPYVNPAYASEYWSMGRDYKGVSPATLGAYVIESTSPVWDNVTDVAAKGYFNKYETSDQINNDFFNKVHFGDTLAFYAYGDYILMADKVSGVFRDKFAVIDDAHTFELDYCLYLDLYNKGNYVDHAPVVQIEDVNIPSFEDHDWDFEKFLDQRDLHYPGTVYADAFLSDDKYVLKDRVDFTTANAAGSTLNYGTVGYADAGLTKLTVDSVTFDDGITAEDVCSCSDASCLHKLYTNANTLWYFIDLDATGEYNEETKVTQYKGVAPDGVLTVANNATSLVGIFADNVGLRGNGSYATIVFVIGDTITAKGFNRAPKEDTHVLVTSLAVSDYATGAAFGLPTKYQWVKIYEYTGTFYDLETGDVYTTIYSDLKLKSNWNIIELDKDGVVINGTDANNDGFYDASEISASNSITGDAKTYGLETNYAALLSARYNTYKDAALYNIDDLGRQLFYNDGRAGDFYVDRDNEISWADYRYYAEGTVSNDYNYTASMTPDANSFMAVRDDFLNFKDLYDYPNATAIVEAEIVNGKYNVDFVSDDENDVVGADNIFVITITNGVNGYGITGGEEAVRMLNGATEIYALNSSLDYNNDGVAVFFINGVAATIFN